MMRTFRSCRNRRAAGLGITALLACMVLASCSLFSGPKTTSLSQIRVVAEVNANQDSATELDVVFVYDSDAMAQLPKTGPQWFDSKAALMAGVASAIDVVSVQIPPATLADVRLPARHSSAIAVYVYANYLSTAGQPMSNITPYRKVTIWLTPVSVILKTQ